MNDCKFYFYEFKSVGLFMICILSTLSKLNLNDTVPTNRSI